MTTISIEVKPLLSSLGLPYSLFKNRRFISLFQSVATHGHNSSGPMDMCIFRFLRCLKPDLLQRVVFDPPNPCPCLLWLGWCGWSNSWKLSLLMSWITRSSVSSWRRSTCSLAFLLSPCTDRSFSQCPWHPRQDLILLGTSAFLMWSLAAQTISSFSVFLPGYVSLLPPFVGFLFVSEVSRRCFFLQAAVLAFFPDFLFVGVKNVCL